MLNKIRLTLMILSAAVLCCACAPKNSAVIQADVFTNQHVSGETELESLIVVGDFLYAKKDYAALEGKVEQYLEKNRTTPLADLYVRNLLADIVTYHVVDLDRSYTLNEALVDEVAMLQDQDQVLSFNRKGKKFTRPTLGSRVLFGSAMLVGGWVDPKCWSEAEELIVGKESTYTIKDAEFIQTFFTIPVKEVAAMAAGFYRTPREHDRTFDLNAGRRSLYCLAGSAVEFP